MTRWTASVRIPADHPALPGHFPGHPIVPGSLLLERVLAACPRDCRQILVAKFRRPLLPGAEARIDYSATAGDDAVDFVCRQGDHVLCTGRLSASEGG